MINEQDKKQKVIMMENRRKICLAEEWRLKLLFYKDNKLKNSQEIHNQNLFSEAGILEKWWILCNILSVGMLKES